jgi:tetratricopeptide (TPR) repeat protein
MPSADAENLYNAACAQALVDNTAQAIALYKQALDLDPSFHQARAAYAKLLYEARNVLGALNAYGDAIETAPQNAEYKEAFLKLAQSLKLHFFNEKFRKTLTLCLQSQGADFIDTGNLWLGALKKDPDFKPALNLLKLKKYPAFKKYLNNLTNRKGLLSALLFNRIGKAQNCRSGFRKIFDIFTPCSAGTKYEWPRMFYRAGISGADKRNVALLLLYRIYF